MYNTSQKILFYLLIVILGIYFVAPLAYRLAWLFLAFLIFFSLVVATLFFTEGDFVYDPDNKNWLAKEARKSGF